MSGSQLSTKFNVTMLFDKSAFLSNLTPKVYHLILTGIILKPVYNQVQKLPSCFSTRRLWRTRKLGMVDHLRSTTSKDQYLIQKGYNLFPQRMGAKKEEVIQKGRKRFNLYVVHRTWWPWLGLKIHKQDHQPIQKWFGINFQLFFPSVYCLLWHCRTLEAWSYLYMAEACIYTSHFTWSATRGIIFSPHHTHFLPADPWLSWNLNCMSWGFSASPLFQRSHYLESRS